VDALYRQLLAWREEAASSAAALWGSVPVAGQAGTAPPLRRLGRVMLGLFGFLLGATVSAAVTLIAGALAMEGTSPGDRAVGDAIALAFFVLPVMGLVGDVVGTRLMLRVGKRADTSLN
jgi:hypothetical protein